MALLQKGDKPSARRTEDGPQRQSVQDEAGKIVNCCRRSKRGALTARNAFPVDSLRVPFAVFLAFWCCTRWRSIPDLADQMLRMS